MPRSMLFCATKNSNRNTIICKSGLIISLLFSGALFALPSVNEVTNGNVEITQNIDKSALLVHQSTDKAIVNWNSFNVAGHENVHFQQPTNGICLNRVDAVNGMSQINGNLTATGKIFLINQAGIVFGDTAKINVGGIIASTADIADQNFLNDKLIFDQASTFNGAIINRGIIQIDDGGFLGLFGASVVDDGVIQTRMANVVLASGNKFTLDMYDTGVVSFDIGIDAPATMPGLDENGKPLPHGVNVSGKIYNDVGIVYITADATQGVFDNLINMSGEIKAQSVSERSGVIILGGANVDGSGVISVTGKLDASGTGKNADGGLIGIIAPNISVEDNAVLNASGDIGGGIIIVGQETDDDLEPSATKNVYIGQNVILNADAIETGKGGCIVVNSDLETTFLGNALARGGSVSGDGGKIGIYSKGSVSGESDLIKAKIDISVVNGEPGAVMVGNEQKLDINDELVAKIFGDIQWDAEPLDQQLVSSVPLSETVINTESLNTDEGAVVVSMEPVNTDENAVVVSMEPVNTDENAVVVSMEPVNTDGNAVVVSMEPVNTDQDKVSADEWSVWGYISKIFTPSSWSW